MKSRLIRYIALTAFIAGMLSFTQVPMASAQGSADAKKPTPRLANGHPDLNGFYNSRNYVGDAVTEEEGNHVLTRTEDGSAFFSYGGANSQGNGLNVDKRGDAPPEPNQPPYKPEYMAKIKEIADKAYGTTSPHDPQMDCKPYGLPRGAISGGGGSAMEILQTDNRIAMLYEDRPGPYFRVIYMDQQHPKDLDTSYFGHSVGHWEGDTLVVDVVGLNDETWLGGGFIGPKYALFHSDKEHVIARWTRHGDELTYEATVEDPVMFTRPWVITPRHIGLAAPGDYIQPQMCVAMAKEHLIEQSDKDRYVCGWCQKDIDAIYGQGAKESLPKK